MALRFPAMWTGLLLAGHIKTFWSQIVKYMVFRALPVLRHWKAMALRSQAWMARLFKIVQHTIMDKIIHIVAALLEYGAWRVIMSRFNIAKAIETTVAQDVTEAALTLMEE